MSDHRPPESFAAMSAQESGSVKPVKSLLNPYAASFVPHSLQGASEDNKPEKTLFGVQESVDVKFQQNQLPVSKKNGGETEFADSKISKVTLDHDALVLDYQIPQKPNDEKQSQNMINDVEYDLAYMASVFPGISDESLADVYFLHDGNLEAAIDMMSLLESLPDDFQSSVNVSSSSSSADTAFSAERGTSTYVGETSNP